MSTITVVDINVAGTQLGAPACVEVRIRVDAPLVFEPDIELTLSTGDRELVCSRLRDQVDAGWLPKGEFLVRAVWGSLWDAPGEIQVKATASVAKAGERIAAGQSASTVQVTGTGAGADSASGLAWHLDPVPGGPQVDALSWKKGHADWFFRHFDHAARTIISYMLGDSPLLRGRILDVGCGDGITDLGIALRCEPELFIGADPFEGYKRLPTILADNGLDASVLPPNLRFAPFDANHLPFPDDSFDVVLSWGSLEHIAGGHLQALREIKRVLRPDGLLFAHPGLYYSNPGHHLGEFSDEPFVHLKHSREDLRRLVLNTTPRYMDRSGEFATPEQYWQWFEELNPITVASFETELRALEFEPWRVAIRTEDRIEYTQEILSYPMQDLATGELYVSCINRKRPRPEGFRMLDPSSVASRLG